MKFNSVVFAALFFAAILALGAATASAGASDDAGSKSMAFEKRGPLEKITFIHYKKDKGNARPEGKGKPGNGGPADCYAFLASGAKWKTSGENYVINPENSGMEENFTLSAFQGSAETWDAETSYDVFGTGAIDPAATIDFTRTDNLNVVRFADLDAGTIAVTYVWGYFSGPPKTRQLVEWDMEFNTDFSWGDATFNVSLMDFSNIATHELGHSAGLGDLYTTECTTQTMYGYSNEGETSKRDLDTGDIAGIHALYGA